MIKRDDFSIIYTVRDSNLVIQISSQQLSTRFLVTFSNVLVLGAAVMVCGCGRQQPPLFARVGEPAPNFTFVDLATAKKAALSDLKGKIVIADFWASWCAPCQEPMTKMQTYRDSHPEWGDAVQLLAVSIDDASETAKAHLIKKGWNKTRNVWLDPEGGKSPYVLAYAGQGIPVGYIIGPDGVIAEAGHPGEIDIASAVKSLLAGASKR